MIWKPGDCYTMTVPLHTAGLLLPKCCVNDGLGLGASSTGYSIAYEGRRLHRFID